MGRRKVEIKRIDDKSRRQTTFTKRRQGLFKKAGEYATKCNAEATVIAFSHAGNCFGFGNPSVNSVVHRYLAKVAADSPEKYKEDYGDLLKTQKIGENPLAQPETEKTIGENPTDELSSERKMGEKPMDESETEIGENSTDELETEEEIGENPVEELRTEEKVGEIVEEAMEEEEGGYRAAWERKTKDWDLATIEEIKAFMEGAKVNIRKILVANGFVVQ